MHKCSFSELFIDSDHNIKWLSQGPNRRVELSHCICVFQVAMARVMFFFLSGLLSLVYDGSDPAVDHSIIHENVLFYKEGAISLSSSRWILTLVLDTGVYERLIDKLTSDLDGQEYDGFGCQNITVVIKWLGT